MLTAATSIYNHAFRLLSIFELGYTYNMSDSPNEPKKTDPELTVHPATEPSPETKAKIAVGLGQQLSEALEQAVGEHEGNESPDVA